MFVSGFAADRLARLVRSGFINVVHIGEARLGGRDSVEYVLYPVLGFTNTLSNHVRSAISLEYLYTSSLIVDLED